MRRGFKILLGVGLMIGLLLGAGALAFEPLVKRKAIEKARARGLEVEIGSVRAGWGTVWLRNVSVRAVGVSALRGRVEYLRVDFDGIAPKSVAVEGARVGVTGELALVRQQIADWRARRESGAGGGGTGLTYSAHGVQVTWTGWKAGAAPAHAWGLSYSREQSVERIGADLARIRLGAEELEVRGARVDLQRGTGGVTVQAVSTQGLRARVDLDGNLLGRFSSRAPATPGDGVPPAPDELQQKSPPPDDGSRVAPTSTKNRGKRGGKTADGQKLADEASRRARAASRGVRLRAGLTSLSRALRAGLPQSGNLQLDGIEVELFRAQERLRVGPGKLVIKALPNGVSVDFQPGLVGSQKSPLGLRASLPFEGPASLVLDGGPVNLGWLGIQDGDFGLREVARAQVSAKATLELSADGQELSFDGRVGVDQASIEHAWLAAQPLDKLRLSLKGKGHLRLDGTQMEVHDAEIGVGRVRLSGRAELHREGEDFHLVAAGRVPLAACQDLLESFPRGLAPLLDGVTMTGTFAAQGELDVDTRDLAKMVVKYVITNECRVASLPTPVAPSRFRSTFTRNVVWADGRTMPHTTGPGDPKWVPISSISHHMETAVLVCEDGRFFRHEGFDHEAVLNSIKENVRKRRFVRGASTISMQLAKNLYLRREKTLSRKLQEAFLTMVLEQRLTKRQMMELYLNVIEYAPGVYGIGPAARHYFNTHASQLSLGQSLYIGSILSNPRRQHFGAGGAVTGGWTTYLRRLMKKANRIRLVSDTELEEGLLEQVAFKVPYSPRAPSAEELEAEVDAVENPYGAGKTLDPGTLEPRVFDPSSGAVLPP